MLRVGVVTVALAALAASGCSAGSYGVAGAQKTIVRHCAADRARAPDELGSSQLALRPGPRPKARNLPTRLWRARR